MRAGRGGSWIDYFIIRLTQGRVNVAGCHWLRWKAHGGGVGGGGLLVILYCLNWMVSMVNGNDEWVLKSLSFFTFQFLYTLGHCLKNKVCGWAGLINLCPVHMVIYIVGMSWYVLARKSHDVLDLTGTGWISRL